MLWYWRIVLHHWVRFEHNLVRNGWWWFDYYLNPKDDNDRQRMLLHSLHRLGWMDWNLQIGIALHSMKNPRNEIEGEWRSIFTIFRTCWAKLWLIKTASIPRFFAESIVPSSGGGSFAVSFTVNISNSILIQTFSIDSSSYQWLNLLVYRKINVYPISKRSSIESEDLWKRISYIDNNIPRINRSCTTH